MRMGCLFENEGDVKFGQNRGNMAGGQEEEKSLLSDFKNYFSSF